MMRPVSVAATMACCSILVAMPAAALDPGDAVIFPVGWARQFAFYCNYDRAQFAKGWIPNRQQVAELEGRLSSAVAKEDRRYKVPETKDFLRQYLGLEIRGRKTICVMGYPKRTTWSWRQYVIPEGDMGPEYFHITYEPWAKRFENFGCQNTESAPPNRHRKK